ncbi:transcriptional regulator with XRE-family HTH domain [Nakamurella sp. UYEF19]|uniref:helix-turn-helix domain-containing protein n=1 Tax=Nakamurella sp. UYEF19 TaxID=1756392 RepID=UPI003392AC48
MASLDVSTRLALGKLLRQLRQREQLTLAALSAQVGVTVSALSQFETGKAEPSLGTLWSLGRALNASLFDFFAKQETENVDVTPANERTVVIQDRARYEAIARSTRRRLDLFYLYLEPGEGLVREPVAHAGEEAGVVVSGTMDVIVGEQTHRLCPGDGIWFVSNQTHTFRTVGQEQCVSIWADTLPDHAPERQDVESLFGDGRVMQ